MSVLTWRSVTIAPCQHSLVGWSCCLFVAGAWGDLPTRGLINSRDIYCLSLCFNRCCTEHVLQEFFSLQDPTRGSR
jgi:hypothetical protein